LLDSAKDRVEHQIVIDDIARRFAALGASTMIGATAILALKNIQHLHTPIYAQLPAPKSVVELAALLHPTAALGGDPRELALPLISALEPVTRGWYAAPIGWIDRTLNGEFAVAIRSAVIQNARVWVYAGAGIVAASEPDAEWRETALKFAPMLRALGAA
jgi:menaquinone-specific isochorismate synthase